MRCGLTKRSRRDASNADYPRLAFRQQIAAQVIHSSRPEECLTSQAPEPRDVVWSNVGKSESNRWIRDWIIMGVMVALLLTWLGT